MWKSSSQSAKIHSKTSLCVDSLCKSLLSVMNFIILFGTDSDCGKLSRWITSHSPTHNNTEVKNTPLLNSKLQPIYFHQQSWWKVLRIFGRTFPARFHSQNSVRLASHYEQSFRCETFARQELRGTISVSLCFASCGEAAHAFSTPVFRLEFKRFP